MHAGNPGVRDHGYVRQASFANLSEQEKITNAAHYEVVPRRILHMDYAFTGQTFRPAGVTGPHATRRQRAIRAASETFRKAWTTALNLHRLFARVLRRPMEWNTLDLAREYSGVQAGAHFADALPFWSKVEMLTIHRRAGSINPAGAASARPVTFGRYCALGRTNPQIGSGNEQSAENCPERT
jgi:hypothetical protein